MQASRPKRLRLFPIPVPAPASTADDVEINNDVTKGAVSVGQNARRSAPSMFHNDIHLNQTVSKTHKRPRCKSLQSTFSKARSHSTNHSMNDTDTDTDNGGGEEEEQGRASFGKKRCRDNVRRKRTRKSLTKSIQSVVPAACTTRIATTTSAASTVSTVSTVSTASAASATCVKSDDEKETEHNDDDKGPDETFIRLTAQQRAFVSCPHAGVPFACIRVQACAGAGKSSTIYHFAKAHPQFRILYVVLNADMSAKSKADMSDLTNIDIFTFHALAYERLVVQQGYTFCENIIEWNDTIQEMAESIFGQQWTEKELFHILKGLQCFWQSDDLELTSWHYSHLWPSARWQRSEDSRRGLPTDRQCLEWGNHVMSWMRNKQVPLNFGMMLKELHLQNPALEEEYQICVVDEAQDAFAVVADCLHPKVRVMRDGVLSIPRTGRAWSIYWVGDKHQQINKYLGGRNAMEGEDGWTACYHFPHSWRFGPMVALLRNYLFHLAGVHDTPIVGCGPFNTSIKSFCFFDKSGNNFCHKVPKKQKRRRFDTTEEKTYCSQRKTQETLPLKLRRLSTRSFGANQRSRQNGVLARHDDVDDEVPHENDSDYRPSDSSPDTDDEELDLGIDDEEDDGDDGDEEATIVTRVTAFKNQKTKHNEPCTWTTPLDMFRDAFGLHAKTYLATTVAIIARTNMNLVKLLTTTFYSWICSGTIRYTLSKSLQGHISTIIRLMAADTSTLANEERRAKEERQLDVLGHIDYVRSHPSSHVVQLQTVLDRRDMTEEGSTIDEEDEPPMVTSFVDSDVDNDDNDDNNDILSDNMQSSTLPVVLPTNITNPTLPVIDSRPRFVFTTAHSSKGQEYAAGILVRDLQDALFSALYIPQWQFESLVADDEVDEFMRHHLLHAAQHKYNFEDLFVGGVATTRMRQAMAIPTQLERLFQHFQRLEADTPLFPPSTFEAA